MILAPDPTPGSPLQARSRLLRACDWTGARHRGPSLRFERHGHHHPAPASPSTAATPTMSGEGSKYYPGMKTGDQPSWPSFGTRQVAVIAAALAVLRYVTSNRGA
jgi:hypothetical protein